MSDYRQQFNDLRPEEITYNIPKGFLSVRGNNFSVDNPKMAFIEALEEFPEKDTYETLKSGSRIHIDSRIGDEVKIGCNCTIGGYGFGYDFDQKHDKYRRMPHLGDVLIKDGVTIHNNVNIDRSVTGTTIIGNDSAIDSNVHIGHNVKIGNNTLIAAGATIGGSCIIGDKVFVGCNAFILQHSKIGNNVTIGAGSVVLGDVPEGETWVGNPARKIKEKI